MTTKLDQLKARLGEIADLYHANALLGWDQQTYMPPAGAAARAEQIATLQKIAHQMFTADDTGLLL
ncbi:MAG TPA: carboxypeptidase M32, partial [Anaerolineae bacterium]